MTDDEQTAEILKILKATRTELHVRGTDRHPIVEVRLRRSNHIVGGIELRERIERARERGHL